MFRWRKLWFKNEKSTLKHPFSSGSQLSVCVSNSENCFLSTFESKLKGTQEIWRFQKLPIHIYLKMMAVHPLQPFAIHLKSYEIILFCQFRLHLILISTMLWCKNVWWIDICWIIYDGCGCEFACIVFIWYVFMLVNEMNLLISLLSWMESLIELHKPF